MKQIVPVFISAALLLMLNSAFSQQQPLSRDLLNQKFSIYLHPESKAGWIEFRDFAPYEAAHLFEEQPDLLGIRNTTDEMRIFKENTDAVGNRHLKYSQYYKGIRVEGIEQIVHEKKGKVYLTNGDFVPDLNLNVVPSVSSEQAIRVALNAVPAEKYLWQVAGMEERFRMKMHDENATLYPTPELLIVKKDTRSEMSAANYALAYRVAVFASKPARNEYVYVDAMEGTVLRTRSLDLDCNPTTISTTFNGSQSVSTDFRSETCWLETNQSNSYFSVDDCNSNTVIYSWGVYNGLVSSDDYLVCDDNNTWSSLNGIWLMTMTTLWGVKQTYSYYLNTYGHEGFSGTGGLIDAFSNRLYYHDDGTAFCSNANYTPIIDNLNYGAGADCSTGTPDDFNTDDIVGHEFTHGVIEHAHFDALDYSDESGALNESFADIFGEAVERYIEGTNDWWCGFDRNNGMGGHFPLRCFFAPDTLGQPDTYFGNNWHAFDNDDNGGVHTNSGVQNHIFYMLAQGETGTNDLGWDYSVTGVGFSHAIAIAWQAMMNYVDGSDGYIIDRNCWIQAAIDLYGSCSQDVISVGEAFSAAGVTHYTQFALGSICGTYASIFPTTIDGAEEIRNASVFNNNFLGDCNATINNGTTVTAQSGTLVNLHPGFTATSGCIFTALIVPCEVSDYDPNNLKHANEENTSPESSASDKDFFYLYPNPSDENLTVEFTLNTGTPASIYVVDVTGRKVMSLTENEFLEAGRQKLEVNTSSLLPAAYLLVMNSSGKIQTKKFIVQH